jgi:hypothetical protein
MGINQLTTFMLSMPVLLLLWYYFVVGYSTAGCADGRTGKF